MVEFSLNAAQEEAVKYVDGPLLVLAGAGSGKTRVITYKIHHLLKQSIAAEHIYAITFTNKAKVEMYNRVKALSVNSRGLKISTFHTLGLAIIKKHYKELGFKSENITIFDKADSLKLLNELITSDDNNLLLNKISAIKNNDIITDAELLTIYQQYSNKLLSFNAVDFDDLIYLPLKLFNTNSAILAMWQDKVKYLLVDEYQDTNATQYKLITMLTGLKQNFTVVGDDHQSIYAFRGARPENLLQLQQDYPNLKIIKLEQNYRSAQNILLAANSLIEHNQNLFSKKLWSTKGYGELIKIFAVLTDEEEALRIATSIATEQYNSRREYSDFAILYRSNHQSRVIEKQLRIMRIPYQINGGDSFFSRVEVKDLCAYLRLLVNNDDDQAFLRIVNTPKREIGVNTLEKLGNYATMRNISLFTACYEFGLSEYIKDNARERLVNFCDLINYYQDNVKRGDIIANIQELIVKIGYYDWIKEESSTLLQRDSKLENINELLNWLSELLAEEESLAGALQKIMLVDILERQQEDKSLPAVKLMTMHAAKGLEFPIVYIIGAEEEILPHRNSVDSGDIDEERRLFYVGITRAMEQLTISYCKKRKRGQELVVTGPSRFLSELPKQVISWRQEENSPASMQEGAKKHLAYIHALLANK